MPFYLILTPAGGVEATIGIGANRKTTKIDWDNAPWPRAALGDPDITNAIEAFLRSGPQPAFLSWQEVFVVLQAAGVAKLLRPELAANTPNFSIFKPQRR